MEEGCQQPRNHAHLRPEDGTIGLGESGDGDEGRHLLTRRRVAATTRMAAPTQTGMET